MIRYCTCKRIHGQPPKNEISLFCVEADISRGTCHYLVELLAGSLKEYDLASGC